MPSEVKKEIQLEIAHVLFTDIVGYSKLLIDEQHALLETLNQIVRSTQQFRNAEAAGKLIKIPTGDGMALVFQDRLEAPVECALEISRALKEHPIKIGRRWTPPKHSWKRRRLRQESVTTPASTPSY